MGLDKANTAFHAVELEAKAHAEKYPEDLRVRVAIRVEGSKRPEQSFGGNIRRYPSMCWLLPRVSHIIATACFDGPQVARVWFNTTSSQKLAQDVTVEALVAALASLTLVFV